MIKIYRDEDNMLWIKFHLWGYDYEILIEHLDFFIDTFFVFKIGSCYYLVLAGKGLEIKRIKTTVGQTGCNACGDEGLPSSMKQEKEYLDNQIDASIKLGKATWRL